jgi:hypothetical protein
MLKKIIFGFFVCMLLLMPVLTSTATPSLTNQPIVEKDVQSVTRTFMVGIITDIAINEISLTQGARAVSLYYITDYRNGPTISGHLTNHTGIEYPLTPSIFYFPRLISYLTGTYEVYVIGYFYGEIQIG